VAVAAVYAKAKARLPEAADVIAAMAHARDVDGMRERRWLAEIEGLRTLLAASTGEEGPERDAADDRLRTMLEGVIAGAIYRTQPDMSGDPLARLTQEERRRVGDAAYEAFLLLRGERGLDTDSAPKP
jgi:hypothetical protein